MTALASAQVSGPVFGVISGPPPAAANGVPETVTVLGGWSNILEQTRERREALAQQMSDPVQGARIRAERFDLVKANHPDLGRALRLDAEQERRLLELLVEQQIASDLEPTTFEIRPVIPRPGIQERQPAMWAQAERYTRDMEAIDVLLNDAEMERYLDYRSRRQLHAEVHSFDSTLPLASKLTADQKGAMVVVLQQYQQGMQSFAALARSPMSSLFGDPGQSMEQRLRATRIRDVAINERVARQLQTRHAELLTRLGAVLIPEQLSFWDQRQQQLLADTWAAVAQKRAQFGIAPDLDVEALQAKFPPAVRSNIRFDIDVTINEVSSRVKVTSVGGRAVTIEAPEDLLVEVRPRYVEMGRLQLDLALFERGESGRRLVGEMAGNAVLSNPGTGRAEPPRGPGQSSNSTVLLGRRGYVFQFSSTATL